MISTYQKGSRYRHEVAQWFQRLGLHVESRGLGYPGDDLTVTGPEFELSVECKNHIKITMAAFIDQTDRQAGEDQIPVCFIKRRGRGSVDDHYVLMSARYFRSLL